MMSNVNLYLVCIYTLTRAHKLKSMSVVTAIRQDKSICETL